MAGDKVGKILIVFLGQMFNLLLIFLLTPYLARSLSKPEYGTFAQVQTISTFFVALFSLGISKVFYLTLEQRQFNKKDALTTIIIMTFVLGCTASFTAIICAPIISKLFNNNELTSCLYWYSPFFLFNGLKIILEFNLIRIGKVRNSVAIIVISNIVKLALLLVVIQLIGDFTLIFVVIGIIAPLTQCLFYILVNRYRILFEGKFNYEIFRYVLNVGVPLGITTILAASYFYLSGFYISYFFTPAQFAIYKNGAFEIPFLSIIATSVTSIMTPHFAALLNDGKLKEVVRVKSKSISEVAALTYPVIIMFLFYAKDFLVLYLSEKYIASVPIFFAYTFILFMRVTSYEDVLSGLGRTKTILYGYIIYFLANILGVFILGKLFGIMGATIASVICIYLLAFVLINSTAKSLEVSIFNIFDVKKLIIILFWTISLCSLSKWLALTTNNIWIKGGIIFTYLVVVYLILLRRKLITISLFENLIRKLPYGSQLYRIIIRIGGQSFSKNVF